MTKGAYHVWNDWRGTRDVFLNGVEAQDVVACHEANGWIIQCVRNSAGRWILDRRKGEIVTKKRRGHVKVVFRHCESKPA